MMNRRTRTISTAAVAAALSFSLVACGAQAQGSASALHTTEASGLGTTSAETASIMSTASSDASTSATSSAATSTAINASTGGKLETAGLFTDRDLEQVADTSGATEIALANGQDVTISQEGVYVVSGQASDVTITVEAADTAKVQIVLAGASITNSDFPAIYVKSADKVFVTTAAGTDNALSVTGTFVADGDTNTDAAIFSKDDLTLNGEGTLTISSTGNGVTSKDDLKVTGGTYQISAGNHGLEGKDSVRIAGGTLEISAGTDGVHAENSDDDTLGYVYVAGGSLDIEAGSDAIQGCTVVQIDGGTIVARAAEGIESTYVQINDGTIAISASDDGVNATTKSSSVGTPTIEVRGGDLAVEMGQGDTDALDANGNLLISGGTVTITAQSPFDYDGQGSLTGGTVYVNGEQVTSLQNSMMGGPGGGMMGGAGGMMGGAGGDMMGGQAGGHMGGMR